MSETETLTVAYVGPQQAGVVIDAVGQAVRPVGSPPRTYVDADGEEQDVPTQADVPAELARRLVAQAVWTPVGWDVDDLDSDAGETDETGGEVFPRRKGGGVYELSNGETVRGKDDAIAAQAAIDQGDADGITTDTAAAGGATDEE
jgi:hypothetical protein